MQVLRRSKKICSFSAAFLKICRKTAEKPAFLQLLRRAAFYFRKGGFPQLLHRPADTQLFCSFYTTLQICSFSVDLRKSCRNAGFLQLLRRPCKSRTQKLRQSRQYWHLLEVLQKCSNFFQEDFELGLD